MEDITILLNRAIPIDEKMNVFIRKHHRPVPVADFRAQSGTYISNSTIIAFSFNGNLYMLPYSRKIIAILWDNGFLRSTDYTFKPYFANPFQHVSGGVPNILITMEELNEETIGQLIYFFELACAMSGKILGVNPFDQPGVEAYKKNMFRLLKKPGYCKK